MANLCANITECRFEYLDEAASEKSAYIKWIMNFRHPKFGNRLISVRGVSHIQFNQQGIYFHEDFYDMGAMVYEQVPILGKIVVWIKKQLAS
jgi:hypothetical protein